MAKYTVGNTPVNLGEGAQLIQNLGTGTLYIGGADVATTTGVRVNAGEALVVGAGGGLCFGISDGSADVRTRAGALGMVAVASA